MTLVHRVLVDNQVFKVPQAHVDQVEILDLVAIRDL